MTSSYTDLEDSSIKAGEILQSSSGVLVDYLQV
jgi:hypothetical protein